MGQLRKQPTAASGPKMSPAQVDKQITDYSKSTAVNYGSGAGAGQPKHSACPQCTGGGMNEAHITKAVTEYSPGYKPKPTGQSQSRSLLNSAMEEVFTNTPRTVKTSAPPAAQLAQKRAIAFSKARAAGARLPKR